MNWKNVLIVPVGLDDFRYPIDVYNDPRLNSGKPVCVSGRFVPTKNIPKVEKQTFSGYLEDHTGRQIGFTFFDHANDVRHKIANSYSTICLYGKLEKHGRWLRNPEYLESDLVYDIRMTYPAIYDNGEKTRNKIKKYLTLMIQEASCFYLESLQVIGNEEQLLKVVKSPLPTISELMKMLHLPVSPEMFYVANTCMARLLALHQVVLEATAVKHTSPNIWNEPADPFIWVKRLSFNLTKDQITTVQEVIEDLKQTEPMHRILLADVGTGADLVIQLILLAIAGGGGHAVYLLPDIYRAARFLEGLLTQWPEMSAVVSMLDTVKGHTSTQKSIFIGTTSDLNRLDVCNKCLITLDVNVPTLNMPVSHHIKVQKAHLFLEHEENRKRIKFSKLTTRPTERDVKTHIWRKSEKGALYSQLKKHLSDDQLICVYSGCRDMKGLKMMQDAAVLWGQTKYCQNDIVHPCFSHEHNRQVIERFRKEQTHILQITSNLSESLELASLRHLLIIGAQRMGLSQIHRIRGNLARSGGRGDCHLFINKEIQTCESLRLKELSHTNDGYRIAALESADIQGRSLKRLLSQSHYLQPDQTTVAILREWYTKENQLGQD